MAGDRAGKLRTILSWHSRVFSSHHQKLRVSKSRAERDLQRCRKPGPLHRKWQTEFLNNPKRRLLDFKAEREIPRVENYIKHREISGILWVLRSPTKRESYPEDIEASGELNLTRAIVNSRPISTIDQVTHCLLPLLVTLRRRGRGFFCG